MENSRRNPLSFNSVVSHLLKILPSLFITSRGDREGSTKTKGNNVRVGLGVLKSEPFSEQSFPSRWRWGTYMPETELGEGGQDLQGQEPWITKEGSMQSRVRFGFREIPWARAGGGGGGTEAWSPEGGDAGCQAGEVRARTGWGREGRKGRWEAHSGG